MLSETGNFSKPTTVESNKVHMHTEAPQKKKATTEKEHINKHTSVENAERAKLANRKAQQIFMDTICDINTEADLKTKLKFISRQHLNDIAEERSLSHICGYPLCTNVCHDEFGKRSYIIRRNRVYDVALRRLFCSNKCFHAFDIVKSQIPETPLFLRTENDPEFCNLQISFPDISQVAGKFGTLVDISSADHRSFSNDNVRSSEPQDFNNTAEESSDMEVCGDEENNLSSEGESMTGGMEEVCKQLQNVYINANVVRQDGKQLQQDNLTGEAPTIKNVVRNEEQLSKIESAKTVEKRLKDMMSFETLKLILGETYLRGMLEHFGKSYAEYSNDEEMHLNVEANSRYIEVCRKIDDQEAAVTDAKPVNNMPDVEQLQKDTENLTIKVKSFLVGKEEHEEPPKEQEQVLSLPLIDSYHIKTWRRKIFFDELNKYLPHHVKQMNLNEKQIMDILKPVIYSFDLSPHNIYFTPSQWSLVCLSFLKMLSIRYEVVEESFRKDGRRHTESVMLLFDLDNLYLERLLSYLTELHYILEKRIRPSQN